MNDLKNTFITLLVSLLITACNAETIQGSPTPTLTIPTETPTLSIIVPTETESVFEEAVSEPDLISAKFIDFERVIPADMELASQSQEVVSQYSQITNAGSNLWAGGSIQDINFFSLQIKSLNRDAPDLISLSFPLHLNITKTAVSHDDVNILSLIGGGGGGESIYFPSPPLQAGEFELTPDDPTPVILMKEVEQISYDFTMSCTQSGSFDLNFKIPYSVKGNMATKERTFEYGIQIVCPETATLWYLEDLDNGQIENGGRWILQDAHYVPLR